MADTRPPAVAGYFYPAEKRKLASAIRSAFEHPLGPGEFPTSDRTGKSEGEGIRKVECLVVPHAGYVYSGPVAAHSYLVAHTSLSRPKRKTRAIIFGPNHYGIGSGLALSPAESWATPFGQVRVDLPLTKEISASSSIIDIDPVAHSREHSIEVQIPLLQSILCSDVDLSIVPLCMMLQDYETARQVADGVTRVTKKHLEESASESFLFLGSSDLTHYEPHEVAAAKDKKLLQAVVDLDVSRFYSVLERQNVTACGYGAIATVMHIAKNMCSTEGKLLKYATSGDVTGDKSAVVGYSAVHFL